MDDWQSSVGVYAAAGYSNPNKRQEQNVRNYVDLYHMGEEQGADTSVMEEVYESQEARITFEHDPETPLPTN